MLTHDSGTVQPSRIYIVEEGPNPSTDYFVLPLVSRTHATVLRCSWDQLPAANDLQGATIIFVRYVTAAWRALLEQTRHTLARLIYFMDDDLFDWNAAKGLSWRYRFKLLKRATWQHKWLLKMQPEIWVSTPWLQQKYAQLKPCLVLPTPLGLAEFCKTLPIRAESSSDDIRDSSQLTAKNCKVFYHGTGSHQAEIEWLLPVIERVLAVNADITFEIIGNAKTKRLYRHLTRVSVIPQMKWTAYQDFIKQPGRHIGLAPMLEHPFNLARSYTKFFDIHRAGAAGIYAEAGPWRTFIEPGKQGVLVPMQVASWVSAILELAADQVQHARILNATTGTIQQLALAVQSQTFELKASHQLFNQRQLSGQCHVS